MVSSCDNNSMAVRKAVNGREFQDLFLLYFQAAEEYSRFLQNAVRALEYVKKKRAHLKIARKQIYDERLAKVGRLTFRIDNLHETTLKKYTGLTRAQFQRIEICFRRRHPGENNRVKLFMLLHWLATGVSFESVSATFGSPVPEVSAAIFKLLNDFIAVLPDAVRLPNRSELNDIGEGFTTLCGHQIFSKAAGVLGCYHFPIKAVDEDYPDVLYMSKNACYSIQLQIVTNHKGKILNIFIGKPGSIHKQNVLKESSLYQSQNRYPPPGYFLLADHEYSCILKPIAVITPFKESISLSSREVVFNGRYKKAQDILSNAVRMLSKRWKILERDLEHSLAHNIKIITTCCVLYNILAEPIVIHNSNDFNFFVSDEPSLDDGLEENEEASYFRDCLLNNL